MIHIPTSCLQRLAAAIMSCISVCMRVPLKNRLQPIKCDAPRGFLLLRIDLTGIQPARIGRVSWIVTDVTIEVVIPRRESLRIQTHEPPDSGIVIPRPVVVLPVVESYSIPANLKRSPLVALVSVTMLPKPS